MESVFTRKGNEGSNPSLSARFVRLFSIMCGAKVFEKIKLDARTFWMGVAYWYVFWTSGQRGIARREEAEHEKDDTCPRLLVHLPC